MNYAAKNRFVFFGTILLFILLLAAVPQLANAASPAQDVSYYPPGETAYGFVALENFSGSRKLTDAYNTPELGPFMNKVFAGAIALGAILAVFRLAWAGFRYMSSDLPGMKSDAKEIISETLLGLFLLLGIWLILYQINPDILKLKLEVTPAQTTTNVDGVPCGPNGCVYN